MNTLKDRLRAALEAHAETFTASPDAWQRISGKRFTTRRIRRRSAPVTFLLPAAAAAAVAAVTFGATTLGQGLAGQGPAGRGPSSADPTQRAGVVSGPPTGPATEMLDTDPAISAIIGLDVTHGVTTWAWIGRPNPRYWRPYIAADPESCHWTVAASGDGSGDCWPLPALSAARPAMVIASDSVGTGQPVLSGVAERDVTSVTAVLPDGQRFRGVIGTGRGFPVRAWSLTSPARPGTKLIFTGAAGQTLATLSTAAPIGPAVLDLTPPRHGGVTVFRYPATAAVPAGATTAYLIDGHVAFFAPQYYGGAISPAIASDPPAAAGIALAIGYPARKGGHFALVKAFGYAHANVVRVTVRLPDGGQVTAAAKAAGWPGADLRLWQVSIPLSAWPTDGPQPTFTAVAYDAAGRVVGRFQLGQPRF